MSIELSELVRESLLSQGCDPGLLNNFDGLSTISLDFSTIPSILISQVNDFVLVWVRLAEHNAYIIESAALSLLSLIMQPFYYSVTGQLQFAEDDGYTVLKCTLKPSVLNASDFSAMLEEFYISVEKYIEVLR